MDDEEDEEVVEEDEGSWRRMRSSWIRKRRS